MITITLEERETALLMAGLTLIMERFDGHPKTILYWEAKNMFDRLRLKAISSESSEKGRL